MASADLRNLLNCPSCLNLYSDPVMLNCGHNFCRVCIDRALDAQQGTGAYHCPQCRETFQDRPALHRNITLCDVVKNFRPVQPVQEGAGVSCTYCLRAAAPAVKLCLLCEAFLCSDHLRVHSASPEHVFSEPDVSPEDRKNALHRKILEYNSSEDSESVRVSCCLVAIRKGGQVESPEETSGKTRKLRSALQKMRTKREEVEKSLQSVQERRRKVGQKSDKEIKRVTDLFTEVRGQLEDLERKVLSEISGQTERASLALNDLAHRLEKRKDELSRRIRYLEDLCNVTGPLTFPQELDVGGLWDVEGEDDKDSEISEEELQAGGEVDMAQISNLLRTGLSEVITSVNGGIYIQEAVDILLDVNSATHSIHVSADMKTATLMGNQNRQETPESFQFYPQVISKGTFNSGRHYWEVDVRGSHYWKVGVCYPSIQRKGGERREGGLSGLQEIGYNNKSWVMERWNMEYFMIHDHARFKLPGVITGDKIRVLLDYEAGQISFYDLGVAIRHLHTYFATFTEPLHAALLIWDDYGFLKICGGNQH